MEQRWAIYRRGKVKSIEFRSYFVISVGGGFRSGPTGSLWDYFLNSVTGRRETKTEFARRFDTRDYLIYTEAAYFAV